MWRTTLTKQHITCPLPQIKGAALINKEQEKKFLHWLNPQHHRKHFPEDWGAGVTDLSISVKLPAAERESWGVGGMSHCKHHCTLHGWAIEKNGGFGRLKWRKIKTGKTEHAWKGETPPTHPTQTIAAPHFPGLNWGSDEVIIYSVRRGGGAEGDSITSRKRCYQWIKVHFFYSIILQAIKVKGTAGRAAPAPDTWETWPRSRSPHMNIYSAQTQADPDPSRGGWYFNSGNGKKSRKREDSSSGCS